MKATGCLNLLLQRADLCIGWVMCGIHSDTQAAVFFNGSYQGVECAWLCVEITDAASCNSGKNNDAVRATLS